MLRSAAWKILVFFWDWDLLRERVMMHGNFSRVRSRGGNLPDVPSCIFIVISKFSSPVRHKVPRINDCNVKCCKPGSACIRFRKLNDQLLCEPLYHIKWFQLCQYDPKLMCTLWTIKEKVKIDTSWHSLMIYRRIIEYNLNILKTLCRGKAQSSGNYHIWTCYLLSQSHLNIHSKCDKTISPG